MKKKTKIIAALLITTAPLVLILYLLISPLQHWAAGLHQRGITRALAQWEKEDSLVKNWDDAIYAINMMRQTQHYYVPADGYRSNPEIENALAAQRQKTLEAIGHGLETYTGEHFGTDIDKWEKWRTEKTAPPK